MRAHHHRFIPYLLCLLAAAAAGGAASGIDGLGPITGERFDFSERPAWSYWGVWSGEELLIVDSLYSRVMRFSPDGEHLGNLPDTIAERPSVLHAVGSGQLLLENERDDGDLVEFPAAGRAAPRVHRLLQRARGPEGNLVGVYNWVPLSAESLLLFGDVEKGDSGFSAFVRLELRAPERFEVLDRIELTDPARRLYVLGNNYLAGVNGKPYYVLFREHALIARPGATPLTLLRVRGTDREPYRSPDLPNVRGIKAARPLYQAIEQASMPAGLYGWQGHLYVLMRRPSAGGTAWAVVKVDPAAGRIVWNRPLDSRAAHLTVVTGDRFWAFVEKGRVLDTAYQSIPSFLRVRAEELEK